jgi:plastocyanin
VIWASALGLVLSACVLFGPPRAEHKKPRARVVTISEFKFAPAEVPAALGDTLVWINQDAFFHTTTADSAEWSSPELPRGARFIYVAKRAGRFAYHCAAHPVMRATVMVSE